jgi:hypothetical protein
MKMCGIHIIELDEDGLCSKCLEESNK